MSPRSINDDSKSIIDDSRVMLQVVASQSSLMSIIYCRNMLILQATGGRGSGWDQTLDHGMMRRVLHHCTTAAGLHSYIKM
jgi:hypothetical protein